MKGKTWKYSTAEIWITVESGFEYIQKHIFPGIKPLQMDVETYEKYEEYAKTISKETVEKLEKVNVPLLEELKEKLLETGKGIEQESFLIEE